MSLTECIIGHGANSHGYKARKVAGEMRYLHRLAWEEANGPIPEGLFIDHTCRNRACINVAHLRLVTPRINSIENSSGITAQNAQKTHCVRGHKLPNERNSVGRRICAECKRITGNAIMATPEGRERARAAGRRHYAKRHGRVGG